ncbi:MAG: hypothetical protein ACREC0_02505 [Methylocella sp.]
MTNGEGPSDDRRIGQFGFGVAVLFVAMAVIMLILNTYWMAQQEWYFKDVLREHMLVIVGLPMATGVSVAIVVFLRQTDGPIEFEGLGFKLKRAAGQVTMWILTFLAMAVAMKLLW